MKIIFLIIFGLFLIGWAIFSGIIFYHIFRFDYQEGYSKSIFSIYILVACLIIFLSLWLTLSTNWNFPKIF